MVDGYQDLAPEGVALGRRWRSDEMIVSKDIGVQYADHTSAGTINRPSGGVWDMNFHYRMASRLQLRCFQESISNEPCETPPPKD